MLYIYEVEGLYYLCRENKGADQLCNVSPYVYSSVMPPFGIQLSTQFAICSHCILSICNFYLFPVLVLRKGFGF